LQFVLHVATLLPGAARSGPTGARSAREIPHHVDRDQQAKIARRSGVIFQAPVVSKIAAPSGIEVSPGVLAWYFRPFSTEVTRTLTVR